MKISSLFRPQVKIAGLEISETALRLIRLADDRLEKSEVALEPGVIRDGKLADNNKLREALGILRSRFGKTRGTLPVVVSLPPNKIYTRTFKLPPPAPGTLQKIMELNLPLVSPLDLKTAYYSWQELDGEFFAAFIQRAIADGYFEAFTEASFSVMAAEFPALAVARVIQEQGGSLDLSKPQLALAFASGGLELSIIRNRKLYFQSFAPWTALDLDTLAKEMKKAFDFYQSRWGGQITELILIAQDAQSKIENLLKEHFPFLRIHSMATLNFVDLNSSWYASLGSAIRGASFNPSERAITLAGDRFRADFWKSELTAFAAAWRKVILSSLLVLGIVFAGTAMTFFNLSNRLEKELALKSQSLEFQEAGLFQQKAEEFSQLLAKVSQAKEQSNDFSPLLENFFNLAKQQNIRLTGLAINGDLGRVLISGKAGSEASVIGFKNQLAADPAYKNVSLPLSNIVSGKSGVSFNLTISF